MPNKSFDADTHRQGAARRARDRTPFGALPLRVGQLRRQSLMKPMRKAEFVRGA
jgi:hypothetical protein